jgi:hypothetical protein
MGLRREGLGTAQDEGIRIAVKREGGGYNIGRRDSSR